MVYSLFAIAATLATFASMANAALLPDEVGILVNGRNQESQELGAFYAAQRHVPQENICVVDITEGDVLTREEWDKVVRPAIRKWLGENKRSTRLKCFVTTWSVPLKVGGTGSDDRHLRFRRTFLERERAQGARRIVEMLDSIRKLAATETPLPITDANEKTDAKAFQDLAEKGLQEAQQRLFTITDAAQRQAVTQRFQQQILMAGGFSMFVNVLGQAANRAPADQQQGIQLQLAQIQGRLTGLAEARNTMEGMPPSVQRDASILGLLSATSGRLGQLGWIDAQLELIAKNETAAGFDSELSLILWPEYDLLRWQPNFLHYRYDGSELRNVLRTIMVSRLDGPSVQIARGLVEKAVAAEAAGVQGNIYFDARGLATLESPTPASGSYEEYDVALLKAEKLLSQQTTLPIHVNRDAALFQPGECPESLFYCGWYSLASYVDAFEWAPGAIGYHLASSEASTLHDVESKVWCKKMLEDGITATMGPVYEPYLSAFPHPDDFFPLLMTGKYCLVECYYRTQPLSSWMMTLIGDPLYNPCKNKPLLELGSLPTGLIGSE